MEPKQNDAPEYARKYLEDFLSFFGLNVTVGMDIEGEAIQLSVPSSHLNGFLIGAGGENLRAIQHLLNLALNNQGYNDSMAVVDVAGYKQQLVERLSRRAEQTAKEVLASGEPVHLSPMNAFERRAVHAAIGEMAGVTTESEGRGGERHVVVMPSGETTKDNTLNPETEESAN